ncbi:MAG: amidohydrolase family protein [Phycisphaerales bacterium]
MPDPIGKIDVHTHILPPEWPDLRAKYGEGDWVSLERVDSCSANMLRNGEFFRRVSANCYEPNVRLEECDRAGVATQVISTVPIMFSYWAKGEHALDLSRFLNDHIAGVAHECPDRFIGLGTLPMQSPDLAARELERCVKDLGLPGVEIGTHINEWNLSDPEVFAVFEAAHDLGAAIFVHPWDMMGMERMRKYWLPWLVGMPAESSLAICSVIFGGVLERLPKLRLLFAHGGGAFPHTIGRVERGYNCRPDLCAIDNDHNPREYLGRFWVDSLVHDAEALRYLVKTMGADRVALGSDYPFPLGEEVAGELIDSMDDFDDATRRRLLRENALEFLGLTEDDLQPRSGAKSESSAT